MAEINQTRLRWIVASTPEALGMAVNALPFRIEIKSISKLPDEKWIIWFVLPETETVEFKSGEFT